MNSPNMIVRGSAVILLFLCTSCAKHVPVLLVDAEEENKVVDTILAAGGTVERDEETIGRPVVEAALRFTEAKDALVAELAKLKYLQCRRAEPIALAEPRQYESNHRRDPRPADCIAQM